MRCGVAARFLRLWEEAMRYRSVGCGLLNHIFPAIGILVGGLVSVQEADAASRPRRPYCMAAERGPLEDRAYTSMQQCLASAGGIGGRCYENPKIEWERLERA